MGQAQRGGGEGCRNQGQEGGRHEHVLALYAITVVFGSEILSVVAGNIRIRNTMKNNIKIY
jgi:hypothetical protein